MREFMEKIKADVVLSSVVCLILGLLLLFRAELAVSLVSRLIALALMIFGASYIMAFLLSHFEKTYSLILGLIVLVVGIWFFAEPETLASIIPCVIGIVLLAHGIGSLKIAMETKAADYDRWWGVLIAAVITIVLGILIIIFAFRVAAFAVQLLGIALIYDAVSNFWVVSRASRARKGRPEDDVIDTEGKEL